LRKTSATSAVKIFFNRKVRGEDAENAENFNGIIFLSGPLRKSSATSAVIFYPQSRQRRRREREESQLQILSLRHFAKNLSDLCGKDSFQHKERIEDTK
jgi:hypothetical protein